MTITETNTRNLYKMLRVINEDFKFKRSTSDSLSMISIEIKLNGVSMNNSIMSKKFWEENEAVLNALKELREESGKIIDTNTGYRITF